MCNETIYEEIKDDYPICFHRLMEEYSIRIPIIQREYAQGRDDDDGIEVRKNFVPALIDFLVGEENNLKLDFIFGTIDSDKSIFIPLDAEPFAMFL